MALGLLAGIYVMTTPDLIPTIDPAEEDPTRGTSLEDVIDVSPWTRPEDVEEPIITTNQDVEDAMNFDPDNLPEDLRPEEPKRPSTYLPYIAQEGDTLQLIARKFLGKESLYSELILHNPGLISSPVSVKAGTKLQIPIWLRYDPELEKSRLKRTDGGFSIPDRSRKRGLPRRPIINSPTGRMP